MKIKFVLHTLLVVLVFSFITERANAQFIAAGGYHSLIACNNGTVHATGADWDGQLGDSTTLYDQINTPIHINGISGVIAVAGGADFTLALKSDGTVWAWGYNYYGQLGDNTTTERTYPVQVQGLTGVISIAAGAYHSLAVKSNGTVWAWGYNYYGQLGNGTTTMSLLPVQVTGLTTMTKVAAGYYHSIALKSNGTIYDWGYNGNGQLGNGTTTNSSTPILVSALSGMTAITAGRYNSLGVKNNGTVWGWGYNGDGELGDGTTTNRTSPVQMTGMAGATRVAGGRYHTLILKSNGTVWACGDNGDGQLGDGTYTYRTVPVQVLNLTGITAIAAGYYHSLALKSDGSVWGWGQNWDGELGDGTGTGDRLIPVQVHFCCSNQGEVSLSSNCVNSDTTVITGQSQQTFTISNIGCSNLIITNITSSNSVFTASPVNDTIAPWSSAQFTVTFAPTVIGNNTGTLTIFNNVHDTTMCLTGISVAAPFISLNPTSFNVTLACGDTSLSSIDISNSGAGNLSWNGVVTSYNTTSPTGYCSTNYTNNDCSSEDWMTNFSFNTIQNLNSGCNNNTGNYIYYPATTYPAFTTLVQRGGTYAISMQQGGGYNEGFGVWIDYNRNGDYGDAGEFVYASPSAGQSMFTGNITIPTNTALGRTRLRVRCAYNSTLNATQYCSNFSYGECEEYDITIGAQGISIIPPAGMVSPSGTQNATVKFDSRGMNAGTYNYSLIINSNDPNTPDTVPVTMNIVGTAHMSISLYNTNQPCLNLDSIMANTTSRDSIAITNTGCDTLYIDSLHITPAQYSIISSPTIIYPGMSGHVIVQFAPTTAGTYNGSLSIYSNVLDTAICLIGKAFPGPSISFTPSSVNVTVACNDSLSSPLIINNTGGGVLNWSAVGGGNGNPPTGYCIPTMYPTNSYSYINSVTTTGGTLNITTAADAGFTGNAGTGVNYYPSAMVSQVQGASFTLTVQAAGSGNNARFSVWVDWNRNGVFDASELMVNNISTANAVTNFTITVPVSAVVGVTRMRIIDWTNGSPPAPCGALSGWYGEEEDYLVRVGYPGLTIVPSSGTVNPSGSQTIQLHFNSTGLIAGVYSYPITFTSNDPLNSPIAINATMNVVGIAHMQFSLFNTSQPCLNLDSIMANTFSRDSIAIHNTGCDTLDITSLNISPSVFTVFSSPTTIVPGGTKNIVVQFSPTVLGVYNGSLTVHTNVLDTTICLIGKAFANPTISTVPSSFNLTLGCNDSTSLPLLIVNAGGSSLNYTAIVQNPSFSSNVLIPASCTPITTSTCCSMGIYNVTFGSINNTTGNATQGYQNYTATQSTFVNPGQTYSLSVQTGTSYNEYVSVWIDFNNDGVFQVTERVMNANLNVLPNRFHTGTVTIPLTAVRNKAVRMRVGSEYQFNAPPQPCTNVQYGQFEDYSVKIASTVLLSSSSGIIAPGGSSSINVNFYSAGLNAGNYSGNIVFNSNDPLNNPYLVPFTLHVSGVGTIALTRNCMSHDSIMQNTSRKDSLYIKNTGCDTLHVTNITNILGVYTVNQSVFNIVPGDSAKLRVTFAPTTVGTFIDTLTILNNDVTKKVCLSSKSYEMPVINLNPSTINVTVPCGDSLLTSLTINNSGLGVLNWNAVASGGTGAPPTGYCIPTMYPSNSYSYINSVTTSGGTINQTTALGAGFTSNAGLGVNYYPSSLISEVPGGTFTLTVQAQGSGNIAYISVWIDWNRNGVYDASERMVNNVNTNNTLTNFTITVPLSASIGFTRMRVIDWTNGSAPAPCGALSSYYGEEEDYRIRVGSPGLSIQPVSGTLVPSASQTVQLNFNTLNLNNGVYNYPITILSNDPLSPNVNVNVTMNVVGVSHIGLSRNCLYLDSIMEFTTHIDSLYIKNTGCDTLHVTNITNQTSIFTVNQTVYNIVPGDSAKLKVTFAPVAVGTFTDTLTILNNDTTMKVCLSGKGFARPTVCWNPDSLEVTLGCVDSVIIPLNVCNSGLSPLNFSLSISGGTSSGQVRVAVYNHSGITSVLNTQSDLIATTVSTYNAATLANYDVLMNIRNNNLNQADVLNWISNGGTWIGEYSSNEFPISPWGAITGTSPNNASSGSQSVNVLVPNHYLATHINWASMPVGFDPCDYMRNLTGITDPQATKIISVNHASYGNNPLLVEKNYGAGKIIILNWDYSDNPNYNPVVADMIQEVVRYGGSSATWLSADTLAGTVVASGNDSVHFTFNSTGLNVGTYNTTVNITTNDPLNPTVSIPTILHVIGIGKIELSRNCLYLDSIMEYTTHSDSLYVRNVGCDTLHVTNVTSQTSIFTVNQTSFDIMPGDSVKLIATFAPTSPGTFVDTLTILNSNVTKKVCLSGKAYAKPEILTNPESINVTIGCCDTLAYPLSIYNVGANNLIYSINTNLNFFEGFETPLAGRWVTSGATGGNWGETADPHSGSYSLAESPNGFYGNNWNQYIELVQPLTITSAATSTLSFWSKSQMECCCDGFQVQISVNNGAYTNLNSLSCNQSSWSFHTFSLTPYVTNGSQIKIRFFFYADYSVTSQGVNIDDITITGIQQIPDYLSIAPTNGTVPAGDSSIVNLQFISCGNTVGVYNTNLVINSNDPLHPIDTVPITLNIVGTPIIALSNNCLNLDSIMTYTTSVDSLIIRNTGCDTLVITNITHQLGVYSVNQTTYTILPGDSASLITTFAPLIAGTYNDTLTFLNNNVTQTVCLHGIAYPKPVQCHTPNSLDVHFTICQDSIERQINVCNTNGGSNLNWNLTNTNGESALFDGNGDYINRNTVNLPIGSVMTAEAWIYPTSYSDASYNGIVCWGGRYCSGTSMLLSIQNNGRPSMATWCNDFVPSTGPTAVLNHWNHIACVLNGTSVTLYMNGVPISGTLGFAPNVQSTNLSIGATDYPGRYFNGRIDEVRIYNYAKTQAQILNSMNIELVGNETGLRGYWNFNNGTAQDITSFGNNGTVNGNTLFSTPNAHDYNSTTTFNPQAGTIVAGGNTNVTAMFYKVGQSFGVHNYNIYLNSNDPLNAVDTIAVTMTIDSIPPTPPVANNQSECFGNPIPALTATANTGDTIKWYNSTNVLQHIGSPYNTGQTAAGIYTYYVTSTDSVNGCESRADTVTLQINSAPTQPSATNQSVCFGSSIPALTSTGTFQLWYTNPGLTNHVFTGNPYNTGITVAGTYTFYVSDSTIGCPKSPADTVTLTIHSLPSKPVATDVNSCFGTATPTLSAVGTGSDTIKWYTSALVFIQNGNPLVTGVTSPGIYNYYVTQTDSLLGCISPRDTATLTIHFTPQPTANNQTGCFGSTSTILTATGSNLKWYNSAMTLMYSGNPYNTGLTAVGVDTFYVTQTLNGCESSAKMVILTINPIPSTPVASDITICFGQATPALTATGATIQWYSNATLTNLVHSGSPYNTGLTAVGNYTFYVTQSVLGCASHADTVHLIIGPIPVRPITANINACFGFSVSDFVAASTGSDTVKWFSNPGLTNLVYTGNPFSTGQTAIGTYTYYVNQTDTSSGCHSFSDTVTLVINSTPVQPSANDVNACFGQAIPPMTSTGTIIQWYNDTALTNLVHTGGTYNTGLTTVGSYTFYVKDSTAGCASSSADTATLNIYPIPSAPTTSGNASICIGQSNPTLTATGTNINWYSNIGLTNLVHTGSTFTPTQTAAGTYTFYVTQTANGCSSLASIVVFTIYYTPPVSVSNISIPFGTATPDLIAVGSSIAWYNTAMVIVSTNNTFATGQTAIGAYTYYVTQTLNGCASTPDTVTLTIHPLAPTSTNQTICFGTTVPDLIATGTNINWYSNSTLTNLVHTGSAFPTGQTAVGVYTYYVTQTINSIPSPATIVTLTINAIPTAPVSTNQTACVGGTIPNLTSTGTTIQWYDTTFVVHNGTPFATGNTAVGVYNYSVTQTVNGCESPHTNVSLTIDALPSTPIASDTSSCFGSTTPALTATGTTIRWYNTLGIQVGTGSPYATGITAAGVYNLFVTQTNSLTGCQSLSDTVTLTINFTPPPVNSNVIVCAGLTVPPLTAIGTNIQWYNSAMTQVATGSSYSTGQTAVGVYTYFVTQTNTLTGCQSIPDSVVLTINAIPTAPTSNDANACFGQSIPNLTATGTGIQWYNTSMTLVSSGSSYNTGQSAAGTYTYYVTQSAGGCEGPADTLTLTIHPIPAAPTAPVNTSVCFGQTNPTLTCTGANINWYSDSTLVTHVNSGSTYTPLPTAPGVYTYYVTQTVNGCNSPASVVVFTIYFTPPVSVNDISVPFGTPTPDLIAVGSNITWYDTAMVSVSTNDTFATGQTAIGVYTYYVSQTMNGCESTLDTVTVTIYPSNPPASNQSACFGTTIPDLSAIGVNIQWYSDSLLTNLVFAGNPFSTLQTAVGVYTYYVTQTINGIESPSTSVTLTINAIPAAPVSSNQNACFEGTIPDLTATGTAIQWYDTTTVVFSGSPFATGQTAVGVYSYSVTQTANGCESPHTSVTLTINALPATPISTDTAICFGTSTPDLTSTGVNIQWYDTSGTIAGTGSPFATGITAGGVHMFYVTQTNTLTGCESHADTVSLTIHFTPPPVTPDVYVCALYSIPSLVATGNDVQWYDSSMTFVHSGTSFNTGQTAIGTHVYFVTQTDSVTGCTSTPDSVILSINTAPAAPVVTNTTACFGQSITPLTATGSNLQWYGDTTLTTVLFAGNPYNTGQTAIGIYTYYVTQTTFGCEGPADSISLTIYPTPAMPTTSGNAAICFGQTNPTFSATGTNLNWYSDSTLTVLVSSGTTYTPVQSAPGVYSYYITQSANGCSSPYATVVFTIHLTPPVSVVDASSVFGSATPDLIAVGDNITWYDTAMVSVSTNDTFATGLTAVGAYTYYVSQTLNGCESTLDTMVLTIYPVAPTSPNQTVCYGNSVPDLTATGLNVQWYSDSLLTVPVYSGSPYATGDTAVGSYTYYINQTENNITSETTTVILTINAIPATPVATNQSVCFGSIIPDLTTNGTNITWYDTAMVSVSTNDTFATGQTNAGVYTYTLTQTVNGCESPADTATLTIYAIPLAPTTSANTAICFGTTNPTFTATGTNVQWYNDSLLTTLVFTGSPYTPIQTTAGTFTYYITDSMNGCTSPASTVVFTINYTPPVSVNDTMVAYSLPTPDLITSGTNIQWYDTAMVVVSTNDTLATGQTAVGVYTYYVTQTMNGCESTPDTVVLTIYPGAPLLASQVICAGGIIPDLTAVGTNINWYADSLLTNNVYSGNPYATGQTAPGSYVYYVTQTVNGIQSPYGLDTLTISAVPVAPIAADQSICFGTPTPDLITQGGNINWYDNTMTSVSTLDTFATGQTAVGVYVYTVTTTVNGCESAPDTTTLTINALPATPLSADASACFGSTVPDLISTGNNIQWYDNNALLVSTGNTFATGITASGAYTYTVIDVDAITGCSSYSDTTTLTISVQPNNAPTVADVITCTSIATPDLVSSTGTIIQWYSDASLTTLVNVGNTFATGQTAAGTYTYYVTDSLPGCLASPVDTAMLTINTQPTIAPAVANILVCSGGAMPDLVATTGTIVNWYSDTLLTNLVNIGSNFPTGQTAAGVYTYYVNDNIAGCPAGMTDTVSLTINQTPAMPTVDDTAICFRTALAILIYHGQNVQWYNTSMTLVHSGDVFNTAHVVPGIYPYYVTQTDTVNGCVSPVDSVNMIINSLPGMPITTDTTVCASATIPNLIATGNNIQWYDTANVFLFSGASFATGQTLAGTYPYYVLQNDTVTGCGSDLDTATLVILPVPAVPVANNITVCTGTIIPDLSATGTNVTWYNDATLTTIVNTGNTYTTGQTTAGTYTYFVTDSVGGCTSTSVDSVMLTINQSPPQPTAHDTTICIGGAPNLFSTGNNPHWYSDITLINFLGSGNNFNTGVTNVGTFTYYVTDNNTLCPNSTPDTAHLTINPAPLITANTYSASLLFGNSVTLTAYNAVTYSWAPPTGLNTTTGATVIASPTVTTTYTVTGTNAQGCSSDTVIQVVVTHVGIDEAGIPLEDVLIYPNPAIDEFTIEFSTTATTAIDINLFNKLGQNVRTVREEKMISGLQKHKYTFDSSTLDAGVYMIEIATERGSVSRRLVLIK